MLIEWQEDVVQRLFDDADQLDNNQMGEKGFTSQQLLTTSTSNQTVGLAYFQLFNFKSMFFSYVYSKLSFNDFSFL